MSTNSNCSFIEVRKGAWYYVLENSNARKNAWDWREAATAYGPFPSKESALDHLDNHPNPGGYNTEALKDDEIERNLDRDPVLKNLIESAQPPQERVIGSLRRR